MEQLLAYMVANKYLCIMEQLLAYMVAN